VIYPLVDLAINNGNIEDLLVQITSLSSEMVIKFRDLLTRVDLENVIEFSSQIVGKTHYLDLLDKLIYSDISNKVKERKQLHKILEKQLWVFGEQYAHTPRLFSDKNLENNLKELRNKYFNYEPSAADDNLVDLTDVKIKDITDLFFFNENIISDEKREIMIVELKAPRCAISHKELGQVDKYLFDIEQRGTFSKELSYRIILVSSKLSDFAKSKIGQFDKTDRHLYTRSQNDKISIYVYEWSDLIARNRARLSYLGNALRVQDHDIRDLIRRDYSEYGLDKFFPDAVAEE